MKNKIFAVTPDVFRNHTVMILYSLSGAIKSGIMNKEQAWDMIERYLKENIEELNKN